MLALAVIFFGWFGFLASWVGLVVLGLYLFVIGALFEDDWWLRGFLFLSIPIIFALGIGSIGVPHWTTIVYIIIGYLGAGILWTFPRFAILVGDVRKVAEEIKRGNPNWANMSTRDKGSALAGRLVDYPNDKYYAFLEKDKVRLSCDILPKVTSIRAKARIFSWVLYWPFSLMNYVYTRLLKDLVDFVIERLKGVYHFISEQMMKGLEI